ncbi:MAG TPA: dienelactone hydrolase family protein [Thermoanaerobaculia bacterium]|nr:dienelactone hydrolase family protein [Thermoanaerobaculia bacterium]
MRPHLRQQWADAVWAIHFTKDGWGRPWVQRNAKYDAAAILQNVRIPVLWFLADNDHNVPSGASAPRIAAALREAGNQNATVVMLKNATHGFLHSTTGNNSEFATASRMAPGYWDEMQRWLRRNRFSPRR